jgi:hypothetical protein
MRAVGFALVALAATAFADPPPTGLRLVASVEPECSRFGEPLRLVARFENMGSEAVRVFFEEQAGGGPFPAWRFVCDDGVAFVPMPFVGQTMWVEGIQGEVARLEPGEAREFRHEATSFARVGTDGGADIDSPEPLPPGTWRVECLHRQETAEVPVAVADFRVERRAVEGLWTGALAAEAVEVTVLPADRPSLAISIPRELFVGDPVPLSIRVENPGVAPLEMRGMFVVEVHSKAYSGGFARLRLGTPCEGVPGGAFQDLVVPPARAAEFDADLARFAYAVRPDDRMPSWGLLERIPEGAFHVSARFEDPRGETLLASNGLLRVLRRRPIAPPPGLALRLVALPDGRVEARIENLGTEPAFLCEPLAYPRDLYFSIRDASGRRGSVHAIQLDFAREGIDLVDEPGMDGVVPEGRAWSAERFDRRAPRSADAIRRVEPGGSLARAFDLTALVAGGLDPGEYLVRAHWRNDEDGRRLGRPGVAVGRLSSDPLPWRAPGG